MTGQDLYDELKHFLNFAGLQFADMDKIEVYMKDGKLCFSCGGYSYAFNMEIKP